MRRKLIAIGWLLCAFFFLIYGNPIVFLSKGRFTAEAPHFPFISLIYPLFKGIFLSAVLAGYLSNRKIQRKISPNSFLLFLLFLIYAVIETLQFPRSTRDLYVYSGFPPFSWLNQIIL